MEKLKIKTFDPNFLRDLKEAHIHDLNVVRRFPDFPIQASSADPQTAIEQFQLIIHLEVTFSVLLTAKLVRDWLYNRIKKGNCHKIAIEGQEVTKDPEKVVVVFNTYIEKAEISINPKPDEQKKP